MGLQLVALTYHEIAPYPTHCTTKVFWLPFELLTLLLRTFVSTNCTSTHSYHAGVGGNITLKAETRV